MKLSLWINIDKTELQGFTSVNVIETLHNCSRVTFGYHYNRLNLRWGILGVAGQLFWTCVRHFCSTVTDLVEWFSFLSALRSLHSFLTFTAQIIFSLLRPAVFAFVNQQGIQWAFLAYHHIPKQYSTKLNEGHCTGFYFTLLSGSSPTSVCSGKMSWAFSASLSFNWQTLYDFTMIDTACSCWCYDLIQSFSYSSS